MVFLLLPLSFQFWLSSLLHVQYLSLFCCITDGCDQSMYAMHVHLHRTCFLLLLCFWYLTRDTLTNFVIVRCRRYDPADLQGQDGDTVRMTAIAVEPIYAQVIEEGSHSPMSKLDEWPEYTQFHFDRNKLEFGVQLGEGHFGKVWKAWAIGISEGYEKTEVAVKTVKQGAPIEVTKDFKQEIRTLAEFDHVNIITLLGVCLLHAPLYMITELMNKVCSIVSTLLYQYDDF